MSDYVDISQVLKGDVELEIDPNADPFSRPRLPEGQYVGKLDFNKDKAEEFWQLGKGKPGKATEGQQWLWTSLKFTVTEGEFEGYQARDGYVDTRVSFGKNSRVGGICLAAGKPLEAPFTNQRAAAALQNLILGGQAVVKATIVWEARFSVKHEDGSYSQWDAETITGLKSPDWPKNEHGDPELDFSKILVDSQGEEHTVKAFINPKITRYSPVKD